MFPHLYHRPSPLAKCRAHFFVATNIACQFRTLVRDVTFRNVSTLRTVVPETAIDKHEQPLLLKNKIRFTWQGSMPPPSLNGGEFKCFDQPVLCRPVTAGADADMLNERRCALLR